MTLESSALQFVMHVAQLKLVPRTSWLMRGIGNCEDGESLRGDDADAYRMELRTKEIPSVLA